MRLISCAQCGCQRQYIVTVKAKDQLAEITTSFRPLCIPCLLRVFHIDVWKKPWIEQEGVKGIIEVPYCEAMRAEKEGVPR